MEQGRLSKLFKRIQAAYAPGAPQAAPEGPPAGQPSTTAVAVAAPPPPSGPRCKFSDHLDQANDATFDLLPPDVIARLRRNYVENMGGPPSDAARPSEEQISALAARLKSYGSPFVDFALFGPYGSRQAALNL